MTPTTRVRPAIRWLLAVFLVALIPYVAWSIWDYHEASRLADLVHRARAVLPADQSETPAPADDTIDAVRLYFAAGALVPGNMDLPRINANPSEEASAELRARTRAVLGNYEPVFRMVAQARTLPANPWSVESPDSQSVSWYRLEALLTFRTRALARLGETEAAAASLLDEADLLRVIAANRVKSAQISFFVGSSAIQAQIGSDLAAVLEGGHLPHDALDPLSKALSNDPPDELRTSILSQVKRLLRYTPILNWNALSATPSVISLIAQRASLPAERSRISGLLQDRLDSLDVLGDPALDWPARLQRAEQASAQAPRRTNSMLASIAIMTVDSATRVAIVRAARLAVAVERYRQQRGEVPVRLSDLSPDELDAVPADPFDGQPLRYRVDEGEVGIYSVGRNRSDDGGKVDWFGAQGSSARFSPDVGIRFPIR